MGPMLILLDSHQRFLLVYSLTTYMLRSPKTRTLIVRYDHQSLVFNTRFAAWLFKRKLGRFHWEIAPQAKSTGSINPLFQPGQQSIHRSRRGHAPHRHPEIPPAFSPRSRSAVRLGITASMLIGGGGISRTDQAAPAPRAISQTVLEQLFPSDGQGSSRSRPDLRYWR